MLEFTELEGGINHDKDRNEKCKIVLNEMCDGHGKAIFNIGLETHNDNDYSDFETITIMLNTANALIMRDSLNTFLGV